MSPINSVGNQSMHNASSASDNSISVNAIGPTGAINIFGPQQKQLSLQEKQQRLKAYHLPSPNLDFTGREAYLTDIHASLEKNNTLGINPGLALKGLGGIGKTELAKRYLYLYSSDENYYAGAIWLNAEEKSGLLNQWQRLGINALEIPQKAFSELDQNSQIQRVYEEFDLLGGRYLLVLDNVENYDDIKEFISPGRNNKCATQYHFLLTTRCQHLSSVPMIGVNSFSEQKAIEFIQKIFGHHDKAVPSTDEITNLAKSLHCFPLAISVAANFIAQHSTIDRFLASWNKSQSRLLERLDNKFEKTTYKVLVNCLDKIAEDSPLAIGVLRALGYLASERIPINLLDGWRGNENFVFEDVSKFLQKYSLIEFNKDNESFNMHRLIQLLLRLNNDAQLNCTTVQEDATQASTSSHSSPILQNPWLVAMFDQVHSKFKFDEKATTTYANSVALSEHVSVLLEHKNGNALIDTNKLWHITYSLAEVKARLQCQFESAKQLHEQSINYIQDNCNDKFAQNYNRIATCYQDMGQYEKALENFETALKHAKKAFGEESLQTAGYYNDLGLALGEFDKLSDAENNYKKAIEICESTSQQRKSEVHALVLSNMAILYGNHGEKTVSELETIKTTYAQPALEFYKKKYGENHPETMRCYGALAGITARQKKFNKSIFYHEKIIPYYENEFGRLHKHVTLYSANMGWLLMQQKKYFEAISYLKKSLYFGTEVQLDKRKGWLEECLQKINSQTGDEFDSSAALSHVGRFSDKKSDDLKTSANESREMDGPAHKLPPNPLVVFSNARALPKINIKTVQVREESFEPSAPHFSLDDDNITPLESGGSYEPSTSYVENTITPLEMKFEGANMKPTSTISSSGSSIFVHSKACDPIRPTHYEYALMSEAVYQDGLNDPNKHGELLGDLKTLGWELHNKALAVGKSDLWDVASYAANRLGYSAQGYLGAVFVNHQPGRKQVVIAHRGSRNLDSWLTDFKTIVGQRYSSQLTDALKKTMDAEVVESGSKTVRKLLAEDYTLSFTGHSLGAFLAEVSVFLCENEHLGYKVPGVSAVTFDSPGSREFMQVILQSNLKLGKVDIDMLDIITYLSWPNIVNSYARKVGTVYHLRPELELSENAGIVEYSPAAHSMSRLRGEFDPETGLPLASRPWHEMADWPKAHYSAPSVAIEVATNAINSAHQVVSDVASLPAKVATAIYNWWYSIQSTTPEKLPYPETGLGDQQYKQAFKLARAGCHSAPTLDTKLKTHYVERGDGIEPGQSLALEHFPWLLRDFLRKFIYLPKESQKAFIGEHSLVFCNYAMNPERTEVRVPIQQDNKSITNVFILREALTKMLLALAASGKALSKTLDLSNYHAAKLNRIQDVMVKMKGAVEQLMDASIKADFIKKINNTNNLLQEGATDEVTQVFVERRLKQLEQDINKQLQDMQKQIEVSDSKSSTQQKEQWVVEYSAVAKVPGKPVYNEVKMPLSLALAELPDADRKAAINRAIERGANYVKYSALAINGAEATNVVHIMPDKASQPFLELGDKFTDKKYLNKNKINQSSAISGQPHTTATADFATVPAPTEHKALLALLADLVSKKNAVDEDNFPEATSSSSTEPTNNSPTLTRQGFFSIKSAIAIGEEANASYNHVVINNDDPHKYNLLYALYKAGVLMQTIISKSGLVDLDCMSEGTINDFKSDIGQFNTFYNELTKKIISLNVDQSSSSENQRQAYSAAIKQWVSESNQVCVYHELKSKYKTFFGAYELGVYVKKYKVATIAAGLKDLSSLQTLVFNFQKKKQQESLKKCLKEQFPECEKLCDLLYQSIEECSDEEVENFIFEAFMTKFRKENTASLLGKIESKLSEQSNFTASF